MNQPKGRSLLTDSEVRKIYESRLPEFREGQCENFELFEKFIGTICYRNVIPRTIEEKRAIVYKMKAQYLNHKNR